MSAGVRVKKKQRESDRSRSHPHAVFCSPGRDCKSFATSWFAIENRSEENRTHLIVHQYVNEVITHLVIFDSI